MYNSDIAKNIILAVLGILLIGLILLGSTSKADSLKATIGVGSKHYLPYELNEENGGIGIGYGYDYNTDISINIDYIRFINSYNVDTKFYGLTVDYTPFAIDEYKLGVFGGAVYNEGYCGFYDYCKEGQDNTSVLPMFGGVVQLDNLILKGMMLPNTETKNIDAIVWNIQMKIMEF